MRRSLSALPFVLVVAGFTVGSMWEDPTFEKMVADAELIAVVDVVEGGPFVCTVRAGEILKGTDPGAPFLVGGYNNPNWPAHGIEKETLAKGERLLAFLHRARLPEDAAPEGAEAKEIEGWAVPTPTTGDFRIIDGKVHGSWYDPSYPHAEPGVDAELVLVLVRGYLLHLAGTQPEEARKRIAAELTPEHIRSVPVPEDVEDEESDPKKREERTANAARVAALAWLMCAQGAYGEKGPAPALLEAAGHAHPFLKICAARAMRSTGASGGVLDALGRLLLDAHSLVQAEAARTLALGGFRREDAVPLLLKALPTSSSECGGSTSVMDPLLNRSASGREMMVRALTRMEASKEAHDELVKLLRDEGLTEEVFAALSDHFVTYPSAAARKKFIELYMRCPEEAMRLFHRFLFREKSPEAVQAVGERAVKAGPASYETLDSLRWLADTLPRRDRRLATWVAAIVRECARQAAEEDGSLDRDLVSFAVLAADEETARIIEQWSTAGWDEEEIRRLQLVRDVVRLQRSPEPAGKASVDQWIGLAARWEEDGDPWLRGSIYRELVAATPGDLRSYAVGKLRKGDGAESYQALRAINDLGGALTEEQREEIEEGRRSDRVYLGE